MFFDPIFSVSTLKKVLQSIISFKIMVCKAVWLRVLISVNLGASVNMDIK